ncbi:protein PIN-LIKES 2-like [Diospyros lotus]|uniref:protein PIN-LIKES 2-like n=1 Tax=Diospyros lotus TaxID=55363 RepID=UPI002256C727|nr:protein PIN-LIKES 2-like [Diospyros lotus]
MFRFLAEIYNNIKLSNDVLSAVVPLLKLLTLTVVGLVLAHPRTQIIPKATFRLLSKLVFTLFLPCLIFTHLGNSITLKNVTLWWFIPANVLVSTLVGCILGFLVVIICRPPAEFTRFTIIMTAFGNTGNLPLSVVSSICHSAGNPFGPHCRHKGVAYVTFAHWVAVILVYTLVYHMMEPPLRYHDIVEEGTQIQIGEKNQVNNFGKPLLKEAERPGVEDEATELSKTPFVARIFNSVTSETHSCSLDADVELEGVATSPKSISYLAEPRVAEQTTLKHILLPGMIASLLAIIVGMAPQIKSLFFGHDAPLSFITDSLEILAGAMVPSVMLVLGGMLAEGPNDSKLGLRTTIGITAARLFVLPLLGIGIAASADKLDILVHGDQMYKFVLLLQYTTPSAILLGAIANLRGYAIREASALLFWQHLCALFSCSLYMVVYFKLLSYA